MSLTAAGLDRHAYLETAPLRPGDRVRFISPSGLGSAESLERAIGYYRDWGLEVTVADHVLDPHPRAKYLAGPDEARRDDLVRAWLDPDVDAVVCVRGGYGAMRLLDGIDWEAMGRSARRADGRPKLLTGSSDITALHEAFRAHLDVPTLFCPMPGNDVFRDSDAIRCDVQRWLFEPWQGRSIVGPRAEVMVAGHASGRFTGGNLALLAGALGAPEAAHRPDGILFLEDVDEELYRLDGFLLGLVRSGRIAAASGIVLGSWHKCAELEEVESLMREYLADLGVPVLWEQGFGHDPHALSIPLNVDGELHAGAGGDIELVVGGGGLVTIALPALDPRATWSIRIVDAETAEILAEHAPDTVCETASIGKVFLLIDVARRLHDGSLDPDQRVPIPEEHRVADSGLLYRMRDQELSVEDAALFVGAFSDNLATNALIALRGLAEVRAVAPSLGYADTSLHDYIRSERTPDLPWTPSYGTAAELADLMRRLGAGQIVSAEVSDTVLTWLAANADTSMVADALLLDPLAHVEPEYQGMVLRHKTGSTSVVRADVGHLTGPAGGVAYAIAANWKGSSDDLRAPVLDIMHAIGEQLRRHVTGRDRDSGA